MDFFILDQDSVSLLNQAEYEHIMPILMSISAVRIFLYIKCAILSAKSDSLYHWFAPLFTAEAVTHGLLFVYEFLRHYLPYWFNETFCNFLLNEIHFVHSSIIFIYWAIYYFLFQDNQKKVCKIAIILFSHLMFVTMVASIVDAALKDESVCESKRYTGFAYVYMCTAAIVVSSCPFLLIGWFWFSQSEDPDKYVWWFILWAAICVRMIGLGVFKRHIITHDIAFRAIPIIYPIVFLLVAKRRLATLNHYRIFSATKIDKK